MCTYEVLQDEVEDGREKIWPLDSDASIKGRIFMMCVCGRWFSDFIFNFPVALNLYLLLCYICYNIHTYNILNFRQ